ncbi:Uncharacterised protein [Mycobacterium tuberculosis]|nr:Uncharacterised protein [Mycobacterium tuberculosis]
MIPLLTRRNTLRIARRSKITLVLLCSASHTRGCAAKGSSTSGSLVNVTSPVDVPQTADETISDRRNCGPATS